MDKTHNISLGGFSFIIEDKAYQELSKYLNDVRKSLGNNPDTEEIIYDVEQRMAELLKNQMKGREVIASQDVHYLIEVLGTPEQYVDEEAVPSSEPSKKKENSFENISTHFKNRKLYRDIDRKKLGGVLAGLSHYLNFDVAGLRIIYLVLLFLMPSSSFIFNFPYHFNSTFVGVSGFWIVMYIVFWVLVPPAEKVSEKIEMQGKSVTIDTLSASKNPEETNKKELYRNVQNRMLGGVLSGLSEYFSVQTTWIRILFIIALLGFIPLLKISSLLLVGYVILWIAIPEKPIFLNEKQENSSGKDKNPLGKTKSTSCASDFPNGKTESTSCASDFPNEKTESTSCASNFPDGKTESTSCADDFPNEKIQNSSDENNFYNEKIENTDEDASNSNSHQNFKNGNTSFSFEKPKNQGCWGFIRAIFKGILYVIIGFCALILSIILLSLIMALFGVGIAGWGFGFALLAMTDYLPFVVGGDWQLYVTYISVFSLLVLPISIISILCLKLFSKKGYKTPTAWILFNVFLFFFGVMGSIIVAVDTFKHFQTSSYIEETIHFSSKDTITLAYQSQPNQNPYEYNIDNFDIDTIKEENEIVSRSSSVRFFVKETTESEPYIILQKFSRGRNISDAKTKAEQIKYDLKIDNSKVILPELYSFGKNSKIRDQRVRVYLYLPQGKYITSPNEEFLVIDKRRRKWINISNNAVAKMTENGLIKIEKDSLSNIK